MGKQVQMVEIDEILDARDEQRAKTTEEEQTAEAGKAAAPPPARLEVHACGLPVMLVQDKKLLTGYLRTHGITHKDRSGMEYHNCEREPYDLYTEAMQAKRVGKEFFVAALRLWCHGYPLNPEKVIKLNDIRVESVE